MSKSLKRILLSGSITVLLLNHCGSEHRHALRSTKGESFIEQMVGSPERIASPLPNGDTIYQFIDRYIVWGSLANPDTRDNRVVFDEFFCGRVLHSNIDTFDIYIVNFHAGCNITNDENLHKNPTDYDNHTSIYDNLRTYAVQNGKLKYVEEVYNYQQYAEIIQFDYELYCFPEKGNLDSAMLRSY